MVSSSGLSWNGNHHVGYWWRHRIWHHCSKLSVQAKNACAALLILWYCIYGFTWGPGCWIVTGEIRTGQLRERTNFLTSIGSILTSVPINFVNPYVQKAIGGRVTFIYGAFSVVSILFIWMWVPETRRRSLEGLDEFPGACTDLEVRQLCLHWNGRRDYTT